MYKNPFIMIHLVPTNDKKKKKEQTGPRVTKFKLTIIVFIFLVFWTRRN